MKKSMNYLVTVYSDTHAWTVFVTANNKSDAKKKAYKRFTPKEMVNVKKRETEVWLDLGKDENGKRKIVII